MSTAYSNPYLLGHVQPPSWPAVTISWSRDTSSREHAVQPHHSHRVCHWYRVDILSGVLGVKSTVTGRWWRRWIGRRTANWTTIIVVCCAARPSSWKRIPHNPLGGVGVLLCLLLPTVLQTLLLFKDDLDLSVIHIEYVCLHENAK